MTVNQLETNARFVGFLLVRSADARTDKKGGAYLDLTLADKTGDINCKYWDWNQLMDVPKQGSVIKVQGLVQEYNSRKQLRIERMRAALPAGRGGHGAAGRVRARKARSDVQGHRGHD